MKPFEQQTADAIRALTLTCVVLAVGLVLAIAVAGWGLISARDAADAAKAGLISQTANRTANVARWCGAIDALDRTLTAYVAGFAHVPRLHLTPLDCAALEQRTLTSTRPH